jgi:ATP-binding cassette, subfamily B, bacterial
VPGIETCFWSSSELSDAVSALASRSGLASGNPGGSSRLPSADGTNAGALIEHQAQMLGCEAQRLDTIYRDLQDELASATPAIIRVGPRQFVAAVQVRRGKIDLLTPAREVLNFPLQSVCDLLRSAAGEKIRHEYGELLELTGMPQTKRARVIRQLVDSQTGQQGFGDVWMLRAPVDTSLPRFLIEAGVLRKGTGLLITHLMQYLFWLASWQILGNLSFEGRMDRGWLLAWALLLLGIVPLRTLTTWLQGSLAAELGMNLKRRLLLGALKSNSDEIRQQGVGSLLGQAFEAEAVENLALSGGITGLLSALEIAVSALVLGSLSILLALWCLLTGAAAWHFFRRYQSWTGGRLEMTGELVESMVGNRSRLAQQNPKDWHRKEDAALARYLSSSAQTDRAASWLVAAIPRGWLIAGLCCLASGAIAGTASTQSVALQLGGILLAFNAFRKLSTSSLDVGAAAVAGTRIAPLFQSASKPESVSHALPDDTESQPNRVIAEVEKVTFRYRKDGSPTLHPSSLAIKKGERVLLEGPSGGGKSTFASLLSGMRKPDSGLVLINGLDGYTVGAQRWRKQVAASPQFHDNHILTETLAFNLLMGRNWPPSRTDIEEARAICDELGLSSLLERMPGGLMQMVGEGGWQLSHGEKSRIYIARSLLQNSELVILDESFAALDPETLTAALQCTVRRAKTLLVIAHP